MKLLKTIKSTFESIGMAVLIFFVYGYIDGAFVLENLYFCLLISAALVWLSNKALRWQGEHNELEECPYCGAELEFEKVQNTRLSKIKSFDADGMGRFLMDWGIACIKNEEPKDVFKWLEEEEWTDEE